MIMMMLFKPNLHMSVSYPDPNLSWPIICRGDNPQRHSEILKGFGFFAGAKYQVPQN
jgi:hypothetical protein